MVVIFALALVGLIGMVGLIIDGGDTFLQRRDQQNVADAVAMAAGYASVNGQSPVSAAVAIAAANGYVNGQDGTTVTVTANANTFRVDITRPHRNLFSGVMGFTSWNVSTSAEVHAGVPNGTYGAMPLIFNKRAFDDEANRNPNSPRAFGEPGTGTQDVPQSNSAFNWTVFCTANGNPCNANSDTVRALIDGVGTATTVYLNDLIGPLNAGAHATLFDSLANMVGRPYPVAIVADDGRLLNWAWFHVTGSVGGSTKQISGWFDSRINAAPMTISQTGGVPQGSAGAYVVELID